MSNSKIPVDARKLKVLSVGISFDQIVSALMHLEERERESFLEDLLAATSPEYLRSIEEARRDYKEGRIYTHEEAFREQR
ncbi:hypothetical protein J7J59_06995 [Candidatus Aerophobetes bacterium]|nr:hypothetical protein [Candidatus Aerophobetes bacterium]